MWLLLICTLIGLVVGGLSGIWLLGVIVGGFIFLCALPYYIVMSFIHGEVKYSCDRADERQYLSDLDRMYEEDMRHYELMDKLDESGGDTYNIDARSVNYYGGDNGRIRD